MSYEHIVRERLLRASAIVAGKAEGPLSIVEEWNHVDGTLTLRCADPFERTGDVLVRFTGPIDNAGALYRQVEAWFHAQLDAFIAAEQARIDRAVKAIGFLLRDGD